MAARPQGAAGAFDEKLDWVTETGGKRWHSVMEYSDPRYWVVERVKPRLYELYRMECRGRRVMKLVHTADAKAYCFRIADIEYNLMLERRWVREQQREIERRRVWAE